MKTLFLACILSTCALHNNFAFGDDFQCPDVEGLFAAQNGENVTCQDYYECQDGLASKKSCPANEGFSPYVKECRWEGFVNQCIREKGSYD